MAGKQLAAVAKSRSLGQESKDNEGTTIKNTHEIDTSMVFRKAEIRAERLVAVLRMAVALGLGLSFVAVSLASDTIDSDPVLVRQKLFAGGTIAAYFTLGLVSWLANRRGVYQPWMAWPAASADCLFLLTGIWLTMQNTNLSGSYIFVFPSIWLAPLVLSFGTLRFNPWLQAYITLLIVSGLFALSQMALPGAVAPKAQAMAFYFMDPPNFMRLFLLGLTGLVLIVASVRTRAVLLRSITEAQHSANLTRYLPAQLAPRLAKGGLAELRRGKRQQMGVLFIDLRGFTSWSQDKTPQAITEFVTEFRRRVSQVARATDGIIDKFIGDAAMIVFEEGADARAAARACVTCAEGLDHEMADWSRARLAAGQPGVRAGVGLHWGEVFSGVVGDQDRLEYTVFGDTVNTASRLEQMTQTLGVNIVASRNILEQAALGPEPEGWTALAEATVRGRTETVAILGRTVA